MRLHGEQLDVTTVDELVASRGRNGARPFLHVRGEILTYEGAADAAGRVAAALAVLGISKGDVVTSLMYNSVEHVALWFGCARLGAIWAPLNVSLRPDDLRYCLEDTSPRLMVVDEELVDRYLPARAAAPGAIQVLMGDPRTAATHDMLGPDALTSEERHPGNAVQPSDPMAIVYTGGSTGMPKGVLVPHLYYISAAMRFCDVARMTATDTIYESGHLFHSGGQQLGITGPMFCDMTSVMTKWFSVSGMWPTVKQHRATVIHVPGTMLGPLLDLPSSDADADHQVRIGVGTGTALVRREVRDAFERRFNVRLLEVYAQTEMGVLLCSERVHEAHRPGTSGHSDGWAEVRIVDDNDVSLGPGETGQIVTRPSEPNTFMLGYWNKAEETARTWRNLWHHTGDLGYLDDDGFLYLVGRQAHWIRRRGENIAAFEVESVLSAHPAVAECAVVGVPAELGDEDVKAYVQRAEGAGDVSPADLVAWCAERLAYFKCPRYVEFIDDFPRTASKRDIERHTLKARGIGQGWDATKEQAPVAREAAR